MMTEKEFFQELSRVPELPPDLFKKTEMKIRHRSVVFKSAFALAATVIIAIGTTGVLVTHRGTDQALSPDVAAELLSVRNYLAGEDLDRGFKSYGLYEEETNE